MESLISERFQAYNGLVSEKMRDKADIKEE